MFITPEFELSLRLAGVADALADCAVWRALVDEPNPDSWDALKTAVGASAGTAAAALERIHWERADERNVAAPLPDGPRFDPAFWPLAILADVGDQNQKASNSSWIGQAEFELEVEIPIPSAYYADDQAAVSYHRNAMGLLRRQFLILARDRFDVISFQVWAIDQCDPAQVRQNLIRFCHFGLTLGTWEPGA